MTLPTIHPSHPLLLTPEPLTPPSFAPFGTLITSPLPLDLTSFPASIPLALYPAYQPQPVSANQSTALKTSPVSPLVDMYPASDATKGTTGGTGLMSIFSSFPRRNVYSVGANNSQAARLKLGILERHPYTTQTFCPFNYSTVNRETNPNSSTAKTCILIIVAPTLPDQTATPRNPPDLSRLRAFIHPLNESDSPNVAVTYNAGTWHAPMIVLGSQRVDFLVTQFANGVANDDCQEVLVGSGPDGRVLSAGERGRKRRKEERVLGGGSREVEVDLGSLGVEIVVEGKGESGEEKGTANEMVTRAGRTSKL